MQGTAMAKCFYCEKEVDVEAFRNPYTKEIHPTCEQCIKAFTSFPREKLFFSRAIFILPLFILGSIVLIFFNWRMGLFGLIIFVILEALSVKLLSHYKKKTRIALGTYVVDPRHIRWCKTCKNYRKVRKYDDILNGIWTNEQLPDNSCIPCKIINETIDVWKDFFMLDSKDRTLFPKDCPKWTKNE